MAGYDIEGARAAGVSDAEIANALAPRLNYDLDGARKAGIADKEIADALAAKFATTAGGAATGNPSIQAQGAASRRPLAGQDALLQIGGAGVVGGVAGALAPEILTGLGAAAGAFGVTAPAAPFLLGAANATRGARAVSAGLGAASGAGAEALGQAAESMGAGPTTAELVRLAGGAVSPEIVSVGASVVRRILSSPLLSSKERIAADVAKEVAERMGRTPEDLNEKERQFLGSLIERLRGGQKSDEPMKVIGDELGVAAGRTRATAAADAQRLLAQAERDATSELDAVMRGKVAQGRRGTERLEQISKQALEAAQGQRLGIGAERETSDIGTSLRQLIVGRNEKALAARKAQFKADESERDAVVAAKEQAGEFVEALPEYKALVADLRGKLLIGKKAQEQTTAPVTEPGVMRAHQTIYDAVTRRRVQTGVNSEGNPTYKEFPTSFEALDDVRRRLGDVFKGKPGDGYEGISDALARKYYAQISEIQKKFAGPAQERLLKQYADASERLAMFGSKYGQKATALDKYDDALFATDASALPKFYFGSKEKIEDLVRLTGDRGQVVQAARDYVTGHLAGKNESQVRAWMTQNRGMMQALPEVWVSVSKYADTLMRGERVAGSVKTGIGRVQQRENDLIRAAERRASELRGEGAAAAKTVVGEAERTAGMLEGNAFPVERVVRLIEGGTPDLWRVAGPTISAHPQSKAAVEGAVRQVLANRVNPNAAPNRDSLSALFSRRVRPALEGTGLMDQRAADEIARQIHAVETMRMPESEKVSLTTRLILQGIAGYASTLAGRAAVETRKWVPN